MAERIALRQEAGAAQRRENAFPGVYRCRWTNALNYAKIFTEKKWNMSSGGFESQAVGDRLYADAVCAQCGTVNPEGTLICKTCGNNLRDQRALRLTADQILVGEGEPIERRKFFLGSLTVLGILLVLWTGMNVDSLADWLIRIQKPTTDTASLLWEGSEAAPFDALAKDLQEESPDAEVLRTAITNPDRSEAYDGWYAVTIPSPIGPRVVGVGNVRQEGDALLFVARLGGGTEVRGRAQVQGTSVTAGWEDAGVLLQGEHVAASGVAVRRPDGRFECFGQSEDSDIGYDFSLYRLPEQ